MATIAKNVCTKQESAPLPKQESAKITNYKASPTIQR